MRQAWLSTRQEAQAAAYLAAVVVLTAVLPSGLAWEVAVAILVALESLQRLGYSTINVGVRLRVR